MSPTSTAFPAAHGQPGQSCVCPIPRPEGLWPAQVTVAPHRRGSQEISCTELPPDLGDHHHWVFPVQSPVCSCPPSRGVCWTRTSCRFYHRAAQNQDNQKIYAFNVDVIGYNFKNRRIQSLRALFHSRVHTHVREFTHTMLDLEEGSSGAQCRVL